MNPQKEYDMLLKFVFIGPSHAGKTSLLQRITKNTFSEEYLSTIGCEFATKSFQVNNVQIKAQIWDTAGQERYRSIVAPAYYRGASGIFLTFDLSSEQSFYDAQKHYEDSLLAMPPEVPTILVGCKSDLQAQRAVIYDIGQALANNLGMPYIETSSKANSNCIEAFEELCKMAILYTNNKQKDQVQPQAQLNDLNNQPVSKKCC